MAKNVVQYYVLSFTASGSCKTYDELKQWCLDDDCYQKMYPAIANHTLLEGLIKFVQDESNHPEKSGIANSTTYRKENGRRIDSSRNYKLVRETDAVDIFHLYVEITKGPNRGHFKMLKNSTECEFLLTMALEHMRNSGINIIVKDLKDAVDKEKLFIARERCEFMNRCILENVAITTTTTPILYDVTKLGSDSKQKPEKKQQRTTNALSKSATKRTDKSVALTSKRLTKSSDDEEDSATETPPPKLIAKNIRLTPKVDRLRLRTVGAGVKESASNCQKSSTINSSGTTKRMQDETDDNNIKQNPKKKKSRHAI